MRNLTCIVCPIGCSLDVEEDPVASENLSVTGNRCPRGEVYAREEIRAPKRVVTATCSLEGEVGKVSEVSEVSFASLAGLAGLANSAGSVRRVPVKTSAPCPREKIPALLRDIYKIKVSLPIKAGDVVLAGWNGGEIDVVATRTLDI
jgi:CxxC motif-containing protein